jgi:hypothetical protein
VGDAHTELLEAAKAVLPLLKASTDRIEEQKRRSERTSADIVAELRKDLDAANIPEADRLRQQAAELEAKDAAILRFRSAVAAFDVDVAPGERVERLLDRDFEAAVREAVRRELERSPE